MKRLTDKRFTKSGFVAISSEERKNLYIPTLEEVYKKLAEYEDAEEQGRLIKLPCKVGDNLYFETYINNASKNIGVRGHQIKRIDINFICDDELFPVTIPLWEIGEYVFLTHEEVEAALEKIKGE